MQIKTIKRGSKGSLVRMWQTFLLGKNFYLGVVDGQFGPATENATKAFQHEWCSSVDGIVGNESWGVAMSHGLELATADDKGTGGPNWPPKPTDLKPATHAQRIKLFGQFDFEPAPTKNSPEDIKILGTWQRDNLCQVVVPQLKNWNILGAPKSGRIFWHKAAKDQLLGLFQAWDDAGLMPLVRSWAGSWNPRFVRGSRTNLSNHAWGTAFDINVPFNGLGQRPALVGADWSVRKLVPLANAQGFWWGGHWGPAFNGGTGRADGMHFEVARL